MKILMPYISRFGEASSIYNKTHTAGGIELFCRLVYKNVPNVIPLEITPADQKGRRVTQMIVEAIVQYEPDILFSNYNYSTTTLNIWKYVNIPIFWLNHITAGAITTLHHIEMIKQICERQPILGFVSDFQFNGYDKRLDGRVQFDRRMINSCYAVSTPEIPSTFKHDIVTIGRMNRVKDPFFLLKKTDDSDLRCKVFSSRNVIKQDQAYFDSNTKYYHNVVYDLPHDDIIEQLRHSKAYMSTCGLESWGITALEALQCGVPLLIRAGKAGHASMEISPSEDYYRLISTKTTVGELKEHLQDFDRLDRSKIQAETLHKHSRTNWIKSITDSLEQTIKTFT